MDKFDIKSVLKKKKGTKKYIASGNWNSDEQQWYINTSSISSKLIQLAGRQCEMYASDIIYSINTMEANMRKLTPAIPSSISEYFGFREMGVDHETFIAARLSSPEIYSSTPYKSIWRLDMKSDNHTIKLELYEVCPPSAQKKKAAQ